MGGYACADIIGVLFRVLKTFDMPEHIKLEYLKEVGITHMRIAEGVGTMCQFGGLIAKLFLRRLSRFSVADRAGTAVLRSCCSAQTSCSGRPRRGPTLAEVGLARCDGRSFSFLASSSAATC